jgi:hypothetical protein
MALDVFTGLPVQPVEPDLVIRDFVEDYTWIKSEPPTLELI